MIEVLFLVGVPQLSFEPELCLGKVNTIRSGVFLLTNLLFDWYRFDCQISASLVDRHVQDHLAMPGTRETVNMHLESAMLTAC